MQDVSAAVIAQDGKILLTRRAAFQKHAGGWEFPGGKIESGETPEQCLVREIREELNLHIEVGKKVAESLYEYDGGAIRLLAYDAHILSGEIQLRVHDAYEWVIPATLTKYNLLPADRPIAEKVMSASRESLRTYFPKR